MLGGGDTQTLTDGKKNLNFMHSQAVGDAKTFPSSQVLVLSLALSPHTSHLVKLSLLNIFDKCLLIISPSEDPFHVILKCCSGDVNT